LLDFLFHIVEELYNFLELAKIKKFLWKYSSVEDKRDKNKIKNHNPDLGL